MTKTDRKALQVILDYLREGEPELAQMKLEEFLAAHPDGSRPS